MTNGSPGNQVPGNGNPAEVDPRRPSGALPPPIPGAAPAPPEGDEVLRAIGELQSGLGGLRALQEQTVRLGEELAKKRAAMATEHARLAAIREQCAAERAAAEELKRELEAGRDELNTRQSEIEQAGEKLRALRQELEAGRAEVVAARQELARESARVESLRQDVDAKGTARSQEADARSSASQARVAELGERIAALEQKLEDEARAFSGKLAEAAAAKASLEGRIASLQTELEEAHAGRGESDGQQQATLQTLRDQIALVEQARDELEDRLAASAGVAADAMSWNARRKERLRLYKGLLQSQARKIVTAKDALAKRQAECEQMLAQRSKLQAAMEAVRSAEKKIASRTARTGAAATVFFAVGSIALIAVLSWAITNQTVPATYIASAVLAPDGRGLSLDSGDVQAWQKYHEGLTRDPGMMEEAAGRFRQRGIVSLGSAPELRSRLSEDLTAQSRQDGSIVLELKGKGAEKTARELDTFVTALASVANASRAGRADGAATEITQPAAAGAEPVEDPRLVYAGGFAGGGVLAAALLGLVVWGRMARSKKSYEEEQSLANALEELTWATPTDPTR